MATTNTLRQERLHIRLDASSKQKLERAAGYAHKSLSDFVLSQALSSAENLIKDHESLSLTQEDWNTFMDALENPPKANARLKQAFKSHRARVKR